MELLFDTSVFYYSSITKEIEVKSNKVLIILALILVTNFFVFSFVNQSPTSSSQEKIKHQQQVFAIRNVNIIPMTSENKIIENATVIIKDKKIVSINKPIPDTAEIIEGEGKWLIPGLIDMHVHSLADVNFGSTYPTKGATLFFDLQDVMTPFVANGVTTILDLNSRVEHFGQRNEITKETVIGPRMALAALIDGGDAWGRVVNTPADGRQAVRCAKVDGYDFIKVYSHLNAETFKAIVDEANIQGLKVVGHIPNA